MSVLIKGMEMPTSPVLFCIHPDGKVFADLEGGWREYQSVPVPPHGRLIEDIAVIEQIDEWLDSVGDVVVGRGLSYYGELLGCIEDAPTIIPGEKDTKKDGGQDDD